MSPTAKKSVQLKKGIHLTKNTDTIINETEKAIEDLKKREIFFRIIEEGDIQKKEIIVQFAINDPLKYYKYFILLPQINLKILISKGIFSTMITPID